jgi:hypothetical protein
MPLKSDFEILVDLRNEVSRIQAFLVIIAFVCIALAVIVAEIGTHVTELERSLAELTGDNA